MRVSPVKDVEIKKRSKQVKVERRNISELPTCKLKKKKTALRPRESVRKKKKKNV